MEFTDPSRNAQMKGNDQSSHPTQIWDFDLLSKSNSDDVFDVDFLQSQANDPIGAKSKGAIPNDQIKYDSQIKVVTATISNDQTRKDEKLAKLVSAGFDPKMAQRALEQCQWDVEMAVDLLFKWSESNTKQSPAKSPSRQSEVT